MKLIPLTQGKFAQVDDEDFEYLNQFKWLAHKKPNTYYACRSSSRKLGPQRVILMHREILKPGIGLVVDHKDRDGLNNKKDNLRTCTQKQNSTNRKSCGKSKYLGVCFATREQKWISQIKYLGKSIRIGLFKTEENAATAYNIFAEKYHGEFANINK